MTHSSNRGTVGGALVAVVALLLAGCGDSDDETTTEADSIAVLDPVSGPETTPPAVSTVVLGGVVGGNSGGVGEDSTDSASEVVRNEDGSCTGWDGRRDSAWTGEFTPGATVTILDAETDEEIGSGEILEGVAENVATDGGEQWQCWLRFEVTTKRSADGYAISVGGASPVPLAADPTRPGFVIGSISTPADSAAPDACTEDISSLRSVGDWSAVGQYWTHGVSSLCFAGLTVSDGAIQRTCSPKGIASDQVVSVVDASDPSIVYDDPSGLQVDPTTLEVGLPVIVNLSNGIPCG